jgi:hypothetical protein
MIEIDEEIKEVILWRAHRSDQSGEDLVGIVMWTLGPTGDGVAKIPLQYHSGVMKFRLLPELERLQIVQHVLGVLSDSGPKSVLGAAEALARVLQDGFLGNTESNQKKARIAGFSNPRKWGRAVLKHYSEILGSIEEE